jgi:hypothetical protein
MKFQFFGLFGLRIFFFITTILIILFVDIKNTMSNLKGIAKILAIIGGILSIYGGVMKILGKSGLTQFIDLSFLSFLAGLTGIVLGIIAIVIGLLILISSGVVSSKKANLGFNGVVLLILGILALLFASELGGILTIVAAVLMFLK